MAKFCSLLVTKGAHFKVETPALKFRTPIQKLGSRGSFSWQQLGHQADDLAFTGVLLRESFRELPVLSQIFNVDTPLHLSLKLSAHFEQNKSSSVDINFFTR